LKKGKKEYSKNKSVGILQKPSELKGQAAKVSTVSFMDLDRR
jgi:hypothetical protein